MEAPRTPTIDSRARVFAAHIVEVKGCSGIVLLVLGGDSNRSGALDWAAKQPNVLNVAASRARRRLYVIGDLNRWGGLSFFKQLAARLPDHHYHLLMVDPNEDRSQPS